jgi:hypothetical protein
MAAICLAAATLGSTSCWFHKPPRAFQPPPVTAKAPPDTTPPVLTSAPDITPVTTSIEGPALPEAQQRIEGPQPPPPPRPPVANTPKPATPAPAPAEVPAAADTPVAPPQLGQIYTPDQIKANTQALDQSLANTKHAMELLATKNLSKGDQETLNFVATYVNQAEQAREKDLQTAVSVAKRAEVLANYLLGRLP